jgi:hypothetical protein
MKVSLDDVYLALEVLVAFKRDHARTTNPSNSAIAFG